MLLADPLLLSPVACVLPCLVPTLGSDSNDVQTLGNDALKVFIMRPALPFAALLPGHESGSARRQLGKERPGKGTICFLMSLV